MGRVNPLEQVMSKLGLTLQSIVIVAGLSFAVGIFENSMAPFQSVVYIAAAALTYAASVNWGLMDGVFVASGTVALLMLASIFRSKEPGLYNFIQELPADVGLFYGLGVIPGLAVELFAGSMREADAERVIVRRRISELNSKLQVVAREKKAAADTTKVDEGKLNRRGNQLAETARRMVSAESVTEVLEALSGTLYDALQPARFFLAVADGTGGLAVSRVEPALEGEPASIPAEEPALRDAIRAGKPITLPALSSIGPDQLPANLLVPVLVGKQVIALIGMELPEASAKEELDFTIVLAHLAQEVTSRFGLPA